jgi:hypothetical protein
VIGGYTYMLSGNGKWLQRYARSNGAGSNGNASSQSAGRKGKGVKNGDRVE